MIKCEKGDWSRVDFEISQSRQKSESTGGDVRLVTSTVTSPTLQASIDAFLKRFKDARHITFDSVSCSAILDAHDRTHGSRILPHYQLDQAKVIVSLGADFLGTWISPVEFTAAWRSRRVPTEAHPEMSYHVHLEGRMSLTGSNADRRFRVAPDEFGNLFNHLYVQLAEYAGESPPREDLTASPVPNADLSALAEQLWNARGGSLVLCNSQDVDVQVLVSAINNLLGNYGKTLDITSPSPQPQGNDPALIHI